MKSGRKNQKEDRIKLKINEENRSPKLVGQVEVSETLTTLKKFEKIIATAKVENAVIVTATGAIYHCTGELNGLPTIEELGTKLIGASVTHNHPIGSVNEYSFSDDDFELFTKFSLALLRGVDEKFIYELNRNANDIDELTTLEEILKAPAGTLSRHAEIIKKARVLNFGYRRWAK